MTTTAEDIDQLERVLAQLRLDKAAEDAADDTRYKEAITALKAAQDEAAADDTLIDELREQIARLSGQVAPFPDMPTLAQHDEFLGDSLDPSMWKARNGEAAKNERSVRWARNVTVAGGMLAIQPKLETSTASNGVTRQYTSGMVESMFRVMAPFAVEFTAAMPLITGKCAAFWPALWSRDTGKREIDWYEGFELGVGATAEAIKEAPHGKLTNHIYSDTDTGAGKAGMLSSTVYDMTKFHKFVGRVDADGSVSVYFDGTLLKRYPVSQYPYLAPAGAWNLLINLQIGSAYYGLPDGNVDWSQKMLVDSVRVWKP